MRSFFAVYGSNECADIRWLRNRDGGTDTVDCNVTGWFSCRADHRRSDVYGMVEKEALKKVGVSRECLAFGWIEMVMELRAIG